MTPRFIKFPFILFIVIILPFTLLAQKAALKYAKVKISLNNHNLQDITALGIWEEPELYIPNQQLTAIYSEQDLAILKQAQVPFTVLIEDMTAHFLEQVQESKKNAQNRNKASVNLSTKYPTPSNYPRGSMNGYLTYDELLATLDKMKALYPHLISDKWPIGDYKTAGGRSIYSLRISDNPEKLEAEPEVLYTSLTHAREPLSMHQMVFFMWYVLENYDTNEEIKNLVDNTQLHFVPCVNPDGYIYNQNTYPNGGGLWRKNRWRDRFGRAFGVDLNRNFGYEWGLENGSSDDPNRGNYRGTAPFSEPETRALRDLCKDHQFQIALNYHSTGNVIIFPWGYNRMPTADATTFDVFGSIMTKENEYEVGSSTDIIAYPASGISDDWMYATTEKNKIFAMTPELGTQHWVPYEEMMAINKENVWQNLAAAHLVHKYFTIEDTNKQILSEGGGTIEVSVFQAGLKEGLATIRVEALTEGVLVTSPQATINTEHLDTTTFSFDYHIPSNLEADSVAFKLIMDNGLFAQNHVIERQVLIDTINQDSTATTPVKETETLFVDAFDTAENWYLSGAWGLCTNAYVSANNSLCDSPSGDYASNTYSSITIKQPFLLTNLEAAYLQFQAKWELEEGIDFVELSAARAGSPFTILKTYTSIQQNWQAEDIDLTDYVGDYVYLRFQIFTDGANQADGFYFDDLRIEVIKNNTASLTVPTMHLAEPPISFTTKTTIQPNPFKGTFTYAYFVNSPKPIKLRIINAIGKEVKVLNVEQPIMGENQIHLNASDWDAGIYFIQMEGIQEVLRVVKL